jgi:DNA-binding NtrC family response regulator
MAPPKILLVDDDPDVGRLLSRALHDEDPAFLVDVAATSAEAEEAVGEGPPDCVVLDYRLPDTSGLDCLRRMRRSVPHVPVIMLTGADSAEVAVEAMKLGAFDYVVKHGRYLRHAVMKVREALGRSRLQGIGPSRDVRQPGDAAREPRSRQSFERIVGDSPALREALALAERAAGSNVAVLLEGESGTGKELFARAVHDRSARASGPFVAQNCAALPEALLEGELFGHVRGAFTGADRDRRGLLDAASGGTLFLDEVSETSPAIQAKLLRVLQEGEVRPLGSTVARRVDVRIVSAANVDLAAAVRDGKLRADLYYRLRVFPIRIPPLRERGDDVRGLATHFAERCAAEEGLPPPAFAPEVLDAFTRYAWPGNVRELQNEVHRLVLCAEPGMPIDLGLVSPPVAAAVGRPRDEDRPLKSVVRDIEVATIVERLREHGYNREATARSLGITREGLWAKMRKLGLEVGRLRAPGQAEDGSDEE